MKKFFKNQKEQFDKAVKQLEIYNKNKTYVLDGKTINIVEAMEGIVKSPKPYSHISKLPNLIDSFNKRFVMLLEEECKPVRAVIESDWQKVKDETEQYDCKDELYDKFNREFKGLLNRLDSCNNFYEAIAMKEESDRLKLRCFEEIEKLRKKKAQEQEEMDKPPAGQEERGPFITTVNVSIANIFHGSKIIESEEDIEELLEYLRQQLKKELKENTKLKLV